jgi:uncharacterized protein
MTNASQSNTETSQQSVLSSVLIKHVAAECPIDIHGAHGVPHWMRVRANGLRLAIETGANRAVVELFALFHDSKRFNEGRDPEHGKRGAENAELYWAQGAFDVTDEEFEQLHKACCGHTYEDVEDPCITVHTCWDADRLDLGRVGIRPDPDRLCTEAARQPEAIETAWQQSMQWVERY